MRCSHKCRCHTPHTWFRALFVHDVHASSMREMHGEKFCALICRLSFFCVLDLPIDLLYHVFISRPLPYGQDNLTPLAWIQKEFPTSGANKVEETEWRKRLGRFGERRGTQSIYSTAVRSRGHSRSALISCNGLVSYAGVSGKSQVRAIGTLSDGQKTQLVFCWLVRPPSK